MGMNFDGKALECELRMVVPSHGFVYLGLFPLPSRKGQGPVAAINEKGLAIGVATPEALSGGAGGRSAGRIPEDLLTGFGSVDGVLSSQERLKKGPPLFYVLADRSKIAVTEVTPAGIITIKTAENGVLLHTNHYIGERLPASVKKAGKESRMRLERIGSILTASARPFAMDDFVRFAHDKGTSRDDAILRSAGAPGSEKTRAIWVLFSSGSGPPELHVELFAPDETEREYDFTLDRSFWTEGLE